MVLGCALGPAWTSGRHRPLPVDGSGREADARPVGEAASCPERVMLPRDRIRVLPRHCERSEAIHLSACAMDCFVAPAQNCFAILSRAPRNDGSWLLETPHSWHDDESTSAKRGGPSMGSISK